MYTRIGFFLTIILQLSIFRDFICCFSYAPSKISAATPNTNVVHIMLTLIEIVFGMQVTLFSENFNSWAGDGFKPGNNVGFMDSNKWIIEYV